MKDYLGAIRSSAGKRARARLVQKFGSRWQINAAKTHCVNGHRFTPENTYIFKESNGRLGRHCKACAREGQRKKATVDAMVKVFAEKADRVIQKARSKMTPEDRARADRIANVILETSRDSARAEKP